MAGKLLTFALKEGILTPADAMTQVMVEYMRSNMRVAAMPLRVNNITTVQAIRRRVSNGFAKLCKRLDDINAIEEKPSVQKDYKDAMEALERIKAENEALRAKIAELEDKSGKS